MPKAKNAKPAKTEKKKTTSEEPKPKKKVARLVKGMKDLLPEEQNYWSFVNKTAERLALEYGFMRLDTPVLEETNLFIRSIGKQTDVVQKEMFSFKDKGGSNLTLRPEFTAGLARAYIEHGMINQPQPVKLFTIGALFRHEKPQAGRYRQFHQFDVEVIGDEKPVIDAQVILLGYQYFKELGLDVNVQINSVGCKECRPKYVSALQQYYKGKRKVLCEDCKKRVTKNPLRLLDCKEEDCQELKAEAPQIVDWLCGNCKDHFMTVLDYLDEVNVPYLLNPYIVRGLDYYTQTAFEYFVAEEDEQKASLALGGGGRYDSLISMLGGREHTPAVGMALGLERVILALKQKEIQPPAVQKAEVFLAQLGNQARKKALHLFEELRAAGIVVVENFGKENLKAQLELANKHNVTYTLILGEKELMDETILIRDMDGGVQETIPLMKVVAEMKKRLKK